MGIYEIILALIQEPLEAREKPGEDPPRTVRSTGLQETWACKNKFFLFKITQSLMLRYDSPWNCLLCLCLVQLGNCMLFGQQVHPCCELVCLCTFICSCTISTDQEKEIAPDPIVKK